MNRVLVLFVFTVRQWTRPFGDMERRLEAHRLAREV